jgi:hypothetical protein
MDFEGCIQAFVALISIRLVKGWSGVNGEVNTEFIVARHVELELVEMQKCAV